MTGGPFRYSCPKNAGISAIRAITANLICQKSAVLRGFGAFPAIFRVKTVYFTSVKNRVLNPAAEALKNNLPKRESALGARQTRDRRVRDSHRGQEVLLSVPGAS
jgi:hypothetical protein